MSRTLPCHKLLLAVLLAGGIGLLVSSAPAQRTQAQEPEAMVRVTPATKLAVAGADVVFDITVEGVSNLGAYEFHLAFDPNVLSFVSVTNAESFLESTGRDAFCFGPEPNDLQDAIISFACGTTGGPDGPSGDGVLATITFATSCSGNSDLAFVPLVGEDYFVDPIALTEPLGDGIPARYQGGAVAVSGGAPCPTPGTLAGDANCNDVINSIDAALVLQFNARLLNSLPCEANADVNDNGSIDSVDAALILQFVAGLVPNLPP